MITLGAVVLDAAELEPESSGARRLRPTEDVDPALSVGFRVYASPAGHPFCLTWG